MAASIINSANTLRQQHADLNSYLSRFLARQRKRIVGNSVYEPLYDDLCEFICRPGKRVRPLLFMMTMDALKPDSKVSRNARLAIGASMELLHAFILIHDDLIDQSESRRGLPTLHRVIEHRLTSFTDRSRSGANLALVMGDILNALAHQCLLECHLDAELKLRLMQRFLDYTVDTGFGETADIVYGLRDISKVNGEEIERMYLNKTTRYTIECPMVLAAICCGMDEASIQDLVEIADPAGFAFQIQNDLQEFERFEVSDSDVPADVLEGKKTVLMREAFERLSETDQGLLQICLSTSAASESTVSKVRELVVKSGAVGHLNKKMGQLFVLAQSRIDQCRLDSNQREKLTAAFEFVRGSLRQRSKVSEPRPKVSSKPARRGRKS